MRPTSVTLNAAGNSEPIPLDYRLIPFQATIETYITGGPPNFTIQYTTDDLSAGPPANWINASGATAVTADTELTLVSPVTAVRLVYNSGAGSVQMVVLQGG